MPFEPELLDGCRVEPVGDLVNLLRRQPAVGPQLHRPRGCSVV